MGTKNNPGAYDCYANADPDEPMFILLGRDPLAPLLVSLWVKLRRDLGCDEPEKLSEADRCAVVMAQWALRLGKSKEIVDAVVAMHRVFKDAVEDDAATGSASAAARFDRQNEEG
jgi:hypothetical protein